MHGEEFHGREGVALSGIDAEQFMFVKGSVPLACNWMNWEQVFFKMADQ